jgi:O-antigen ligase
VLFLLIYFRPAWGLVLVAFWAPFYRYPKPIGSYRFSPVEMFLLVSLAAFLLSRLVPFLLHIRSKTAASSTFSFSAAQVKNSLSALLALDYAVLAFTLVATLSLFFTKRLDVATNEWRLMIIEPALFYFLLRFGRLQEREWRTILDAFILGGLVVALIGLGQVAIHYLLQNSLAFKEAVALLGLEQFVAEQGLITAEGGLQRLRSVYGSPNNVALYLGRILPFLIAAFLMGQGRRRIAYTAALLPVSLALLLTFSKGALFLGIPASMAAVFIIWQRGAGRRSWPWLVGAGLLGGLALLIALQIPQLAGRLSLQGETGFLRLNLWRASLIMFLDHPLIGVGLDNFLYEYRGRYIFDAAWREPDLNHPHNVLLDLGTRLGLLGIVCGIWLFAACWRILRRLPERVPESWRPAAVGIIGAFIALLFHGLVDHSFFLIDLAYVFYLLAALALWLHHDNDWFKLQNSPAELNESTRLDQSDT